MKTCLERNDFIVPTIHTKNTVHIKTKTCLKRIFSLGLRDSILASNPAVLCSKTCKSRVARD